MNRLIRIGIHWCLVISIASAQEADTSKDGSNQRNPDVPQASAGTVSADSKAVVLVIDADGQQSEVVKQIVEALEQAGVATSLPTEPAPSPEISVALLIRQDESSEKIKTLIAALTAVGVRQISLRTAVETEVPETSVLTLTAQPGYTIEALQRVEGAARTAANRCGLTLGTAVKGLKVTANGELAFQPSDDIAESDDANIAAMKMKEETSDVIKINGGPAAEIAPVLAQTLEKMLKHPVRLDADAESNSILVPHNYRLTENVMVLAERYIKFRYSGSANHGGKDSTEPRFPSPVADVDLPADSNAQLLDTRKSRIDQLRTVYSVANKKAHDLAESLRETPDAAKKAELRTVVQSAFTLRQSLLRAELQEMQAQLEKTQQSLEMRDRIADQIVDRRVEDLLNPQLKWDNSSKSEFHEQASSAPKYQLLGFRLARDTAKKSDTIEAFMKPNITAIIPGSAAEASGFLPGDQVFAVNGLYTWGVDEFIRVIERQSAGPIECMVLREQRSITLELQIPPEIAATPLAIAAQREDSRNTRMVAPITELEGEWHLVAAADAQGKPVEFKPANLIFKNDQYTLAYQGGQIDRRVEVYPDSKEIRYFKDDSGFVQDHYLVEGDQLTIYNENRRNVYQRGHAVLPKTIPKATDEQKSRWRSGIVEILGGPSADNKTWAPQLIGYGVIISPQTRIVSQTRAFDGDSAFYAKFDDGGVVPLKIVEKGSQGWLVFEPEQTVEANHIFRFSETSIGQHDEVHFWGRGTEGDSPKLRLSKTTVSDLERKSPALGHTVWQLLFQHNKLDGSLPVLDANGDLLAITIIGSNELLLAVPVSQLKTMFPESFGPAAQVAE